METRRYSDCQNWLCGLGENEENVWRGHTNSIINYVEDTKKVKVIDRLFVGNIIWSALGITLCVGLWMVFSKVLPPQIPIWYGRPWGESQLAGPVWLLTIPTFISFIGVFNLVVGKLLARDQVLTGLLLSSGMVSQTILVLAFLRIVAIVT